MFNCLRIRFSVPLISSLLLAVSFSEAGIVSGTATFDGTVPTMKAIKMDSDPYCALQHTQSLFKETVIVGENGSLKNVFVYVKSSEELDAMIENGEITAPTAPVVMDQKGCHYEPHVFGIMVGQPLEIRNSDQTLHNVHAMPKQGGAFNIGMPGKPEPWSINKAFKVKEIMVPIKCDVHSWMSSFAGVLDHPFYSVTDAQGKFEIKDLPPGDYVIEAWHEKLGTSEQTVTVADGAPVAISFVFTKPAAEASEA
ncbi:MAG: hypothetical protein HY587_05315 [Candidatus Omnitrophica bacterium]|nr:hypothetical protein [Candidatus Omnitrophota bacterium]